jgi:hypothetical protein
MMGLFLQEYDRAFFLVGWGSFFFRVLNMMGLFYKALSLLVCLPVVRPYHARRSLSEKGGEGGRQGRKGAVRS